MRLLRFVGILALIALGFGLGVLYMLLKPTPLVLHQDAVVTGVSADSVVSSSQGNHIDIAPQVKKVETLFIFYPGGLVRPQAYEWLGVALAPLGVRTVIPIMPLDLAVTAPNRADEFLENDMVPENIVIGGHSLGGAMAARYVLRTSEQIDGLVLMGAFSAESDDLSDLDLETLVLAAENDGLATLEEVQAGLVRLPNADLELIPGAVHSFFGRYGPQRGDGLPTVSRAEAEAQVIEALRRFFIELR